MLRSDLWPGKILHQVAAGGYVARLQQCDWPNPNTFEFESNEAALVLTQTALPNSRKTSFIAEGRHTDFLDPGDLVFMPRGVRVLADATGGLQHCVCLSIDPSHSESAALLDREWGVRALSSCLNVRNSEIERSMRTLARETSAPGLAAEIIVEAMGMYISVQMTRLLEAAPAQVRKARGGLSPHQLKRIYTYIAENLQTAPTVTDLAMQAGISRRHLARAFKQATGDTLSAYIERVRAGEAWRLLRETKLPLGVIAERLGYANLSSFSTAFRRATGHAPREARGLQRFSPL